MSNTYSVLDEIRVEREHQIVDLNYSDEWDDAYTTEQLRKAASCYLTREKMYTFSTAKIPPPNWPWDKQFWKPRTYRENLIRAAALIVAEIERIDRIK